MVSESAALFACGDFSESLTWKVSAMFDAAAVGVPLIAPLEAFSDSPAGSVPLVMDQL